MFDSSSESEAEIIADDIDSLDLAQLRQQVDFYRQKRKILKDPQLAGIVNTNMSLPENVDVHQVQTQVVPVEMSEIRLLLDAIPEYYPGKNLSIFISEVDNLINHLNGRITVDVKYLVNVSIRNKVKGDARDFISFQNAIEWEDIRSSLLRKYGDQRSEELLCAALSHCVQKRNESYLDYYGRLLKCCNDLLQYVSLNVTDPLELKYKLANYDKLALKTFQIGLVEPYRSYISHFQLNSVEECINKCQFYDNRKQEWEYCEFLRKSQDIPKRPQIPHVPVQARIQNNSHNQNSNNFQNRPFPHQNSNPGFRSPLNRSTQPLQRQFPNKQTFANRPGPSSFPNPTPMSVQSRVRTQQIPVQNYQQKPNFISEELFNVESTDLVEESYNENNFCPENGADQADDEYYAEDPENFQIQASETSN